MSPRKDPIPNQDKNILGIQKDQYLTLHVPQLSPVIKSLRNGANDDNPENTDTSRTDIYDASCTNRYDSIENMKAVKKMMTKNTNRKICNTKTVMKVS